MTDTPDSSDQSPLPPSQILTLVGIGASAGGIESIQPLLQSIPSDTKMAFAVVMHLAPDQPSRLTEVLSQSSSLTTVEAKEGDLLQSGYVYVIPPGSLMSIERGAIKLQPRLGGYAPNMPIDFLFQSIAESFGERAIGVVMSGTGVDGTNGLRAIKAANGITFAQDSSAQYSGMPQSAIQSRCVDFVQKPTDISQELARIGRYRAFPNHQSTYLTSNVEESSDQESICLEIFELLRKLSLVDFTHYKRSTIERRIQRRLLVHGLLGITEYLTLLHRNPDEIMALYEDLLIHVTRFFREPDSFEAIKAAVFPKLRDQSSPIRIWIAGCSTGEEVYSIAIALAEFLAEGFDSTAIKIFATDISEEALSVARMGVYLESIEADVSKERLQKFFVKSNNKYQIVKKIRDLCVFARHDMTRDPPFSSLDLISCRNVMIYLGQPLQKKVLPVFHYSLKPGRFLWLGGSETIGNLSDLFDTTDAAHRIYSTKAVPSQIAFDFGFEGSKVAEPIRGLKVSRSVQGYVDLKGEADRLVLNHFGPPGVVVDSNLEILQFRGQTSSFLTPAPGNASLHILKMARHGLLVDLRSSLEEAQETGFPALRENLVVRVGLETIDLNLHVLPMATGVKKCFVVLFDVISNQLSKAIESPEEQGSEASLSKIDQDSRFVDQLQQELLATKEYLQASLEKLESGNEELMAANEEIVSSNEELQSTNEELQTAKEELQASNEELNTVNLELQSRNVEATQLGDDLTNLLRSVNIPIVMVGNDLRIRRFVLNSPELVNLISSDIGRPISDLSIKLKNVSLEAWMTEVLESLIPVEREVEDLQGRWYRLSLRPYRTQANVIDGVVLCIVDIDSMKKSEQVIQMARDYVETILGTIHFPLAVLDSDLRILSVNSAFCDFFHVTSDVAEKRFLSDVGNQKWNVSSLIEALKQQLLPIKNPKECVVQLDLPLIGRKAIMLNAQPLDRDSGRFLLSIEDITSRDRALSMLHESQVHEGQKMESLGRLAGGIAHDFNNLLTVVCCYCEILSQRLESDETSSEMLRAINAAGKRAANLTSQLLAYGRKQMLQPREVDLHNLLREMETLLKPLLTENIHIELVLCNEPATVWIDPGQMEQVIMNLCLNARDAMAFGGQLKLETSYVHKKDGGAWGDFILEKGGYVKIQVTDTGCGMEEATRSRVFEPFFTTKEVGKGTGMGLATVYGIIKQSNGHIEVSSQVNRGTCFTILLPAFHEESSLVASSFEAMEPSSERTVLIVEDEDAIRLLEAMVLQGNGIRLLQARNGEEALQLCNSLEGNVDLLITDVLMPGINGGALATALKAKYSQLKVLYVSGHSEELVRQQGLEWGVIDILQKPFTTATLIQRVQNILAR